MSELIIACVWVGDKYPFQYVTALRNMVARHMTQPYTLACLTDQPERCSEVTFIDVSAAGLHGWWAKMLLFEPQWRGLSKIVYLDLDTLVIGNLAPLVDVAGEFAILESPVRLAGHPNYPCQYNSSAMVIGRGQCTFVWQKFQRNSDQLIFKHERYGDQAALQELYPAAPYLQRLLPGFFCNYRDLTSHKPKAAVINFGGRHKPHVCDIPWVQKEWG
jgi:hypothetical protein